MKQKIRPLLYGVGEAFASTGKKAAVLGAGIFTIGLVLTVIADSMSARR